MTVLPKISIVPLLIVSAIASTWLHAYDSPDFDYPIVDTDALHLPQNERESVVEALNAVACNFQDSELIDEDLKEKALALALLLEPLNVNSRDAHRALLRGASPRKTAFFQNSVSEVSEKLWSSAVKMTGKNGEPAARELAMYLQELALVLNPSPPAGRVKSFDAKTDGKGMDWRRFIELQPDENPSGRRMKALFAEAKVAKSPPPPRKSVATAPSKRTIPATGVANPSAAPVRKRSDASEIKQVSLAIPFVARARGAVKQSTIGGVATIAIGKAEEEDKGLFGVTEDIPPVRAYQMRLVQEIEGFQVAGFQGAERFVRQEFPVWPEMMLAEIGFDTDLPISTSRRVTTADTSLASSLLLHAVFSGKKPDTEMVISGFFEAGTVGGDPEFSIGTQIADVIDEAKAMDAKFLLVPEKHYEEMVEGAVQTRKLEYLFDPQLISYSNWEQLKSSFYGEDSEARTAASVEFKKIQSVQEQMSLVALSRNDKVRERLEKIVADYPQHLSARIMLDFGAAPDDPKALVSEAVGKIDEAIMTFAPQIAGAVEDDTTENLDFSELRSVIEDSDLALTKLQQGVMPEVKNYLYQAKEMLNDAKSLVSSSSNDSSSALQRFEVVKKSFGDLQLERVALGLDRIE